MCLNALQADDHAPTPASRAALPPTRCTKFALLLQPERFTTPTTKPTCCPAGSASRQDLAAGTPQSSAGAMPPAEDAAWVNALLGGYVGLSGKELAAYHDQRWDEHLAMPAQLATEFGNRLVTAIGSVFRQQFRIFEKFDVVDRVLARFPSNMRERHRLDHACLYGTWYLAWMQDTFGKGGGRRRLVSYMRAMKNDPHRVAAQILRGDIVWPEPEPRRRKRT